MCPATRNLWLCISRGMVVNKRRDLKSEHSPSDAEVAWLFQLERCRYLGRDWRQVFERGRSRKKERFEGVSTFSRAWSKRCAHEDSNPHPSDSKSDALPHLSYERFTGFDHGDRACAAALHSSSPGKSFTTSITSAIRWRPISGRHRTRGQGIMERRSFSAASAVSYRPDEYVWSHYMWPKSSVTLSSTNRYTPSFRATYHFRPGRI
jgi:hypothetical protein